MRKLYHGTYAVFIVLCTAVLLGSCTSFPKSAAETDTLWGMIYDQDNSPVSEVEIEWEGEMKTTSDVHGRFILSGMEKGLEYIFSFTKPKYEATTVSITYNDPSQVLYVRLYSADQLIDAAEKALNDGAYKDAQDFMSRSRAAGGDRIVLDYLQALLLSRQGKAAEAEQTLQGLLASGADEPYIHLFLADLYEFPLQDPAAAVPHLEAYLAAQADPDVELRLAALKTSIENLQAVP